MGNWLYRYCSYMGYQGVPPSQKKAKRGGIQVYQNAKKKHQLLR